MFELNTMTDSWWHGELHRHKPEHSVTIRQRWTSHLFSKFLTLSILISLHQRKCVMNMIVFHTSVSYCHFAVTSANASESWLRSRCSRYCCEITSNWESMKNCLMDSKSMEQFPDAYIAFASVSVGNCKFSC